MLNNSLQLTLDDPALARIKETQSWKLHPELLKPWMLILEPIRLTLEPIRLTQET
jgi:hypothetical protein